MAGYVVYQPLAPQPASASTGIASEGLLFNFDASNTASYPGTGTTWTDVSANKTASLGSGVTLNSSNGRLFSFSGTNSFAQIADTSAFGNLSNGISFDVEVNFGSVKNWERIVDIADARVGIGQSAANAIWFGRYEGSNRLALEILAPGAGLKVCITDDGVIDANLNKYSVTLDATGFCRMYKNGVEVKVGKLTTYLGYPVTTFGAAITTIPTSNRLSAFIGRSNWPDDDFEGAMRYVRIYNRALTAAEVTSNVTGTVTYNANGGTGSMAQQNSTAAAALSANTFTRADFTFAGWNTAANGSGRSFANGSTYSFSDDVTLYAQWTAKPPSGGIPTITGTPKVGSQLTAAPGTWTSDTTPSFTFQWESAPLGTSNWTAISGATSQTYTPVTADAGNSIRVRVTATNTSPSTASATTSGTQVQSANHAASTSGTANAVADLAAAIPNDSNTYNVTVTTSNLTTGKFSWSSQPSNVTAIFGEDRNPNFDSGTYILPNTNSHSSTWWSAGFPILSFQGTGSNLRTALSALRYTSTTTQADTLRIQFATGGAEAWYNGTTDARNYVPIYDNGQLTFHYYTFGTQSSRNAVDTQTWLRSQSTLSGISSPNNWHLMTPRYWLEDNRGWALSSVGTRRTSQTLLGGFADQNSNEWYYPAQTDGFSGRTPFYNDSTKTAIGGLYAAWLNMSWFDSPSGGQRYLQYYCNGCTAAPNPIASGFGWDDYYVSSVHTQYLAETWSTSVLNTGTVGTAIQTVRTSSMASAPTNLAATRATDTAMTLTWTAPASTGSDAITEYLVEYSTDNSTWTQVRTGSTATQFVLGSLQRNTAYWFRVAAFTTLAGSYSSSISTAAADTGSDLALDGFRVPAGTTGTIRVLLFTTNPQGKLWFTNTANIDSSIWNTANSNRDAGWTPKGGYIPSNLNTAGRMVGLVDTSISDLNNALATLRYSSPTASTDTIKFWVSNGQEFLPLINSDNNDVNFHYYGRSSSTATWSSAFGTNGSNGVAGTLQTINGVSSKAGATYLATLRFRAENLFLKGTYASGTGWIAADDQGSEGVWRWRGPDVGTVQFWSGSTSGSSVNQEYEDWGGSAISTRAEPNGGTNQNCASMWSGSAYTYNTSPAIGGTTGFAWDDGTCSSSMNYFWEAFNQGAPFGTHTTASRTVVAATPPAAPTAFTATSSQSGQVDLSWTAPVGVSGITSYAVQYSTNGTNWTEARTTDSLDTTQTLSGLTSGTYYHFRVAVEVGDTVGQFAHTYFTPRSDTSTYSVVGAQTGLTSLSVPAALNSHFVRVVLQSTSATATLSTSTTTGITGVRGTDNFTSLSAAGDIIGLAGTGSAVNAALANLRYSRSTVGTDSVQMWISAGTTSAHAQEFVVSVDGFGQTRFHYFGANTGSFNWQQAVNAAPTDTATINGQTPTGKFLATADSQDQNLMISKAMTDAGRTGAHWLYGADNAMVSSTNAEGAWRWLGPDTGIQQFYNGTQNSGTAGAVSGRFFAWGANTSSQIEPNSGFDQNCLAIAQGSYTNAMTLSGNVTASTVGAAWDDLTCTETRGFVWEHIALTPLGSETVGTSYAGEVSTSVVIRPDSDAITGLVAVPAGNGSIAVSWDSPVVYNVNPATGYVLERSTSSNFSTDLTSVTISGAAIRSHVFTGLVNGTMYHFRVRATGSGWSATASPWSSTASVAATATATSLTVVESGGGVLGTNYQLTNGLFTTIGASASINVSDLETAFAENANITIAADTVTVSSAVSWSSNRILTLGNGLSSRVAINADLTATGPSAGLRIASSAANYSIQTRTGANVVLSGASSSLTIGGATYTLIRSEAELKANSENASFWFALAQPITLTSSFTSAPFNVAFTGRFDGLGNSISNMQITTTGTSTGLFFSLQSSAMILNLGVTNARIQVGATGVNNAAGAGIVTAFTGGTVTLHQVWTSGSIVTVTGEYGAISFGGLVGNVYAGTLNVSRSWSSASINTSSITSTSPTSLAGGYPSPCVATGGLVGSNISAWCQAESGSGGAITMTEVFSTGSIKRGPSPHWVATGGLLGASWSTGQVSISDAHAWGSVSSSVGSTVNLGGVVGAARASTTTLQRTYTSSSTCVNNGAYTGCTSGQTAGATLSGTSVEAWGSTTGTMLTNLASPEIPLYVIPTAPTDGSFGTVGYKVVDGVGNDFTSRLGTSGYPSITGTAAWDTISAGTATGTYNVKYVSGLTLSGTAASSYSLNPSPNATSIAITKRSQTVTWSPTTSLTYTSGTATPSEVATSSGGTTISYSIKSGATNTAGCTVNSSTGGLSYTSAGVCTVTATAANAGDYLSASRDVTFTITAAAPVAPTNVTATAGAASGQLLLNWTAPSTTTTGGSIASYDVEQSPDGSTWTSISNAQAGRSLTVSGLTNGTTYSFRVRAINSDGAIGAWSTTATGTPYWLPSNSEAPSISGAAIAVAVQLTSQIGTWDSNGSAITTTTYRWEVSDNGTTGWTAITGATSSTFTPTFAQSGKYLRLVVARGNGSNNNALVEAESLATTIVQSGLASVPQAVSATRSDRSLDVTWSAPETLNGGVISGYKVQYSATAGGPWTTASSSVAANASTYTITGLTNGTLYYVQVIAVTAAGDSPAGAAQGTPSKVASNTNLPTITGTAAVARVLTANTSSSDWNDGGAALTFTYQWQQSATANGTYSDISGATSQTYTVATADYSKFLRVKVTATNAAGAVSVESAATSAVETGLPASPTVVTPVAGDTQLNVSWTAPTELNGGLISNYLVEYKKSTDSSWTTVTRAASTTSSQVIAGLDNGVAYDVRVSAVTAAGTGPAVIYTGTTASTPFTDPVNAGNADLPVISGTVAVGRQLSVSNGTWNTTGRSIAYTYQWQVSSSATGTFTNIATATSSSYTPVTADAGKFLRVVVTATNQDTPVGVTSAGTATTVVTTAVETGLAAAPTAVTPIAGDGQLTVSWTAPTTLNGGVISNYLVEYKKSTDSSWTSVTRTASTTASQVITGLDNAVAYDLRVSAVTAAGTGAAVTYAGTVASTPFTAPVNSGGSNLPTISGTAAAGVALTVSTGTWNTTGRNIVYSYQWQSASTANGTYADISGATSATYTPTANDVGRFLKVVVTATNQSVPDGVTSVGTATTAATLAVQTGLASAPGGFSASFSATPTLRIAVDWDAPTALNGASAIAGYTLQIREAGTQNWTTVSSSIAQNVTDYDLINLTPGTSYDVQVAARTAAGTGAFAATSQPVQYAGAPTNTALPVASGDLGVGETLSVTNGTWIGNGLPISGYTYRWESASDATNGPWTTISTGSATYTLTNAESGRTVRAVVIATNSVGSTEVAVTAGVIGSGVADIVTQLVATPADGQVSLSWSAPTDLRGGVLRGYVVQQLNGTTWVDVTRALGVNDTSRTVTGLSNGTASSFRVFALTTLDGDPSDVTATPYGAPIKTGDPTLSGTTARGYTLTTTDGTWNQNGRAVTTSRQWQRWDFGSVSWVNISGATNATYTLGASDVGTKVRAVITSTNLGGSVTAATAETEIVGSSIASAPRNVTLNPGDGFIDVSWNVPDTLNGGTIVNYAVETSTDGTTWNPVTRTASTLTSQRISSLTNGTSYSVRVRAITTVDGTSSGGTESAIPFGLPINTAAPAISGTVRIGETLTVSQGTWSANGSTNQPATYRWYHSSDGLAWTLIAGATAATFIPNDSYLGKRIRADVSVTNAAGTTTATSAATTALLIGTPATPSGLTVTPGDLSVNVTWTAPTVLAGGSITDYSIELFDATTNTWTAVTRTPSTQASQTVSGLTLGDLYRVRVRTETGQSSSWLTSEQFVAIGSPRNTTAPAISGRPLAGDTLSVSSGLWDTRGSALTSTTYQWFESTDAGSTWQAVANQSNTTLSAQAGRQYRVEVTATNAAGATVATSGSTLKVASSVAQSPVITVTPGDTQLALAWPAPADGGVDITNYIVEYQEAGANSWTTVNRQPTAVTGYTITGLTNGITYDVRVRAVTSLNGNWGYSYSQVPYGAPQYIGTASRISGTVRYASTLNATIGDWDWNGSSQQSVMIQWQVEGQSGWQDIAGATGSQYTISGYVGQKLRVRITATNVAGQSTTYDSASTVAVAAATPSAVMNGAIAPGDGTLTVSWSQPVTLGGVALSRYAVRTSTDGDNWTEWTRTSTATATSETITGLTNNQQYYVQVEAITSVPGTPTVLGSAIPFGLPISTQLPAVTGTVQFDKLLSVNAGSWNANGRAIGNATFQWQVLDGSTWTNIAGATGSTYRVGAYVGKKIRVVETVSNAAGSTSVNSLETVTVIPDTPSVPRDVTVTPADGSLTVSWSAPSYIGGSPITGYTVETSTNGGNWTAWTRTSAATALSETITGLTNGTAYYVRLKAVNGVDGLMTFVNPAVATTPRGVPINDTLPGVTGTPRFDQQMSGSSGQWSSNGADISSVQFQWQVNLSGTWTDIDGATSSNYTVGLHVGRTLRLKVTATNVAGSTVAYSSATTAVAAASPSAPRDVTVTAQDQALVVSWLAPSYIGGTAITDYTVEYQVEGSSTWTTVSRTPSATTTQFITGLTNGDRVFLRIRALNGATGSYWNDSTGTIPRGLPINTAVPQLSGTAQANVVLSADSGTWNNNGDQIGAPTYQWQVLNGSTWSNITGATASTFTPTDHIAKRVRVAVSATNAAGSTVAYSQHSAIVLPGPATSPRQLTATEDDQQVTLDWSAPLSNGGATITDYEVQVSTDGNTWVREARTASADTTHQLTGLTNGQEYYVRIRALNGVNGSWTFLSQPAVPRGLPINTALPVVSGPERFGAVLNVTPGTWDDNGDSATITTYRWQASTDGSTWRTIPAATQESYRIGLYVGSQLRVEVTRTNEAGATVVTTAPTATITAIAAATPVITSQQVGTAQVTVGWTPPIHSGGIDMIGYTLEYSTDQANWTALSFGPTVTNATLTGLTNGVGYFVRVRAETAIAGEWSPIAGPFTPVAPVVRPTPAPAPRPSVTPTAPAAWDAIRSVVMPIAIDAERPLVTVTGEPVTPTEDGRIELSPEQAAVVINGTAVMIELREEGESLVVDAGAAQLNVGFGAEVGKPVIGESLSLTGSGLTPSAPLAVWVQSDPIKVGDGTANSEGKIEMNFQLPAGLTGHHTLLVNTVDEAGQVITFAYGIDIAPIDTEGDPTNFIPLYALLAALLLTVVLVRRRQTAQ